MVIVELINWVTWTALFSLPDLICQIIECWSQESLEGWPLGQFSLSSNTSLLILPTVDFPRPVLSCIWQREYPSLRREMTEECCAVEMAFMVVRSVTFLPYFTFTPPFLHHDYLLSLLQGHMVIHAPPL